MKHRARKILATLCLLACSSANADTTVIAHRGASGYLPEHTLAAYAMAYAQGADFIEPDLVLTRDQVLVARHETMLDDTTDVAERFPERRASDGHFYAADLDYAELATLRTREYRPGRFPRAARLFPVPRFDEILTLVSGLNAVTGCSVGLYPELKSPTWHRERGLDQVRALRQALARQPFAAALRIQSSSPNRSRPWHPNPSTAPCSYNWSAHLRSRKGWRTSQLMPMESGPASRIWRAQGQLATTWLLAPMRSV